jgi:tripartite-type tricarboxylate transporter receptor subunit TctC
MLRRCTILIGAAYLAMAPLLPTAHADDWPSKPVKIIIPFGPSGTSDRFGRLVAAELSRVFKQSFYVQNKPGAAGAIGALDVARARPDGYTLVIAGMGPNITGPALNPNIGYDPINDFTHIAMIAGDSTSFVIDPALGVKTLSEFVTHAKGIKEGLPVGSAGVGTMGHLSLELFRREAGLVNLIHVPYPGGGPLAVDLLGHHLSSAFITTGSGIEQVRFGAVLPLAVTASERIATLETVPTFAELGYPDVETTTWCWISGPPDLPADIVTKLNRAVQDFVGSPKMQARLAAEAMIVKQMDPAVLTAFLTGEVHRWAAFAEEAGLREK